MTLKVRQLPNVPGSLSIKTVGPGGGLQMKTITSTSGPSIVTSGLLLHLDAGNLSSYPGSGTTWTDISGNGKHATLYNSPTYSASNGGILVFSAGSSQYAEGLPLGTQSTWTACVWMRLDSSLANSASPFTDIYGGMGIVNYAFYSAYGGLAAGFYAGGWSNSSPLYTPTLGQWAFHVISFDGSTLRYHVDGALNGSAPATWSASSDNVGYRVARRWDLGNYVDGAIPIVIFYNRQLSDTEILQNFDADKSRFGL